MKGRRLRLEDQLKKTKVLLDAMKTPTATLDIDLKQKQKEAMEQLDANAKIVAGIENDIYNTGFQLKTVMDENIKFQEVLS